MSKTSSIIQLYKAIFFVFILNPQNALLILEKMSVCECPGDSLDLKHIQEDLNIMNMSSET